MAHKRKDTLVPPPDWCKHFKPFGKRKIAKKERHAANKLIRKESNDDSR